MSIAFMQQDFGIARRLMTTPHRVQTAGYSAVYSTEHELWTMFNDFCRALTDREVTNLVRTVQSAEYLDSGCIEGTHRSHFLRNGSPVAAPYVMTLRMDRVQGEWKISARKCDGLPFTWRNVFEGHGADMSGAVQVENAAHFFQQYIDLAAHCLLNRDFEQYGPTIALPYIVVEAENTFVLQTEEELRGAFDKFCGMLQNYKATDMISTARAVEGFGPDMIVGRFSTHILNSAVTVVPPYESALVLRRNQGKWRANLVVNGMRNAKQVIGLPLHLAGMNTVPN
ncbi:hypothetical protein [Poseidonocella pacifica]|nr:hypothetical protein [Poseidonocella pacifica]